MGRRKKRVKFGCIAETFGISGKAMIDNGLDLLKTKRLLEKLQKASPTQFMTLKFRISVALLICKKNSIGCKS